MAMFIGAGSAVISVIPILYRWWYNSSKTLPVQIKEDIEMFDRTLLKNVNMGVIAFDKTSLKHVEHAQLKTTCRDHDDPFIKALKRKFQNA